MVGKGSLPRNGELARTVGQDQRYRLLRLINQDALGSLWEAEDTHLRCPVAIRVLAKTVAGDRRRLRELKARLGAVHSHLDHPRVAYVYGYSDLDGPEQYVVMEPISGETLDRRLKRSGPLEPAEALRLAAEIAEGLQAAHDLGLAHGGLSAESVVLQGDGSIKLVDFGVAAPPAPGGAGQEGSPADTSRLGALLREMVGGGDPLSAGGPLDPAGSVEELAAVLRGAAEAAEAQRAAEASQAEAEARERETAARERAKRRATLVGKAEEATRRADDARSAEEAARAEHARRADQARRAEEELRAEESRRQEATERSKAAASHARAARSAEEAARAEHARRADQARRGEEELRAEESRRQEATERSKAAASHARAARSAEEAARAEHARRTDEVRRAKEALRTASVLLDDFEAEADDGAPAAEAPEGGLTTAGPSSPRPSDAGHPEPPPPAGPGSSGVVVLHQPTETGPPPRPKPVGWEGSGLPGQANVAPRRPARMWLLGGIAVLVVAVAGWLVAFGFEGQASPQPPAPVEQLDAEGVTVPDLRGLTAAEARGRLSENGLALEAVVPVAGTPGVVLNNQPGPGEAVAPGTGVILFIGVEPDRLEEESP